MKTKTWIVLFAVLLVVLCAAAVLLRLGSGGSTAEVYSQGELLTTLQLGRDQTMVVEGPDGGENLVVVQDGQVYVESATCPDQICVSHGPAAAGSPVVCLPNQLVIALQGGDVDAATGR